MVVAAALLGTLAGTSLLVILPGYALSLALGLFTAYEVAMMARKERPPMRARVERAIGPLAGFTGGVASGALAAAGPVLGTYLVAIGLRGAEFAFAINLVFLGMGLVRLAALTGVGLYSAASVGLSALLLVPSFFGQQLGFHFRGRLPANIIQRVVLLALLVASLTLIWRGFEGSLAALGR